MQIQIRINIFISLIRYEFNFEISLRFELLCKHLFRKIKNGKLEHMQTELHSGALSAASVSDVFSSFLQSAMHDSHAEHFLPHRIPITFHCTNFQ